jgi:hypothetical protein
MKALTVLKYVGFGILGAAFVVLAVWVTMLLWNSLIPALFHGPVLTFWQTAGIFILSKILLTGLAPSSHSHSKNGWKKKYNEKYRHGCREEEKPVSPEQA